MKRFLTASGLALVLFLTSSFSVPHKETKQLTTQNDQLFRLYHVTLTTTVYLGNFCWSNISIDVWFSWDGVGSVPVYLGVNNPTVTSNCWGLARTTSITNISGDTDAHLSDIQFGPSGDKTLDEALADPKNLDIIKAAFDDNVDAQKH